MATQRERRVSVPQAHAGATTPAAAGWLTPLGVVAERFDQEAVSP